ARVSRLPELGRRRGAIGREGPRLRAVPVARDEEHVVRDDRRSDRDVEARRAEGAMPVRLARLRVERDDAICGPNDENVLLRLLLARLAREKDGRRVARPILERSPAFASRIEVERDHGAGGTRTEHRDDEIAVDDRRGGEAPRGQLRLELLERVALPAHLARRDVEREDFPHRADGENAFLDDRRGRTWTARVAQVAIVDAIRVGPERLPRRRIEADDALFSRLRRKVPLRVVGLHAGRAVLVRDAFAIGDEVEREEAPAGDRDPRVAAADRLSPSPADRRLIETLGEVSSRPNSSPIAPAPSGPVIRAPIGSEENEKDRREHGSEWKPPSDFASRRRAPDSLDRSGERAEWFHETLK